MISPKNRSSASSVAKNCSNRCNRSRASRAVIVRQFQEIEAFFKRCILAAQADETVSSDAGDAARLLLAVLLGTRVLARTIPDRDVLEGVARPALALLDPPRHKRRGKR
jgi:hypothetical protein